MPETNKDNQGINIADIDIHNEITNPDAFEMRNQTPGVEDGNIVEEKVVEEIDVDDIAITDKKAPIIMLFGPKSSGKSMTLLRLCRYLRDNGYSIVVDETFKSDVEYKEKCQKFLKDLNTTVALDGNAYTDFLLVKVSIHGTTVCQFLEAPGEHYFNPKDVDSSNFPPYMTEIIHTLHNRKIWVFLTEAKWKVSHKDMKAYVDRIRNCKKELMHSADRCIIMYNKIDQHKQLFENGEILLQPAEETMRNEYEGLDDVFRNSNLITRLWRPYNYKFVPFCTGYYFKENGKLKYKMSGNMYPKMLWDALCECIKG